MKKKNRVIKCLAMITQFGITMLVPIFLSTFIGIVIGNKLSQPIICIPFFFIGALAGFRNVYSLAKGIYDDDKKESSNGKKNK